MEPFNLTGFIFENSGPYFPPSPVLAYWDKEYIKEHGNRGANN